MQIQNQVFVLSTQASDIASTGGLIGLMARIIDTLGYPGILALVALESLIPPIPSEAVLPMAGFLAAEGIFSVWLVVLFATIGSLIGALGLYLAGWLLGRSRLLELIALHGSKLGISLGDVRRAEDWFQRHGNASVLIGRLVPLVRSLVSIPAGFAKMPIVSFMVFTALGSLVWNSLLIGAGYLLQDQWEKVEPIISVMQYVVIAVILVLIARFVYQRRRL